MTQEDRFVWEELFARGPEEFNSIVEKGLLPEAALEDPNFWNALAERMWKERRAWARANNIDFERVDWDAYRRKQLVGLLPRVPDVHGREVDLVLTIRNDKGRVIGGIMPSFRGDPGDPNFTCDVNIELRPGKKANKRAVVGTIVYSPDLKRVFLPDNLAHTQRQREQADGYKRAGFEVVERDTPDGPVRYLQFEKPKFKIRIDKLASVLYRLKQENVQDITVSELRARVEKCHKPAR